jgi:hypothetical protein
VRVKAAILVFVLRYWDTLIEFIWGRRGAIWLHHWGKFLSQYTRRSLVSCFECFGILVL